MLSLHSFKQRVLLKGVHETGRVLHRLGYEINKPPEKAWLEWQERTTTAARRRILPKFDIDLVVDIGANMGQYGHSIREIGYRGPIVSFEPQRACMPKLKAAALADGNWKVFNLALGAAEGELELHVAGNSLSSSLLPMLESHAAAAPESRYVATEITPVRTIDMELSVAPYASAKSIWLKIDTQGYEWPVLEGATETLKRCSVLEVELSFHPLYEGQRLFPEIVAELDKRGFALHSMDEVFVEPATQRLLQVDGVFVRMPS
jgi:FkbM family methyltransferase